jgi:hypothetical protein
MSQLADTCYERWLADIVSYSVSHGASTLWEVVRDCEGADPPAVVKCLNGLGRAAIAANRTHIAIAPEEAEVDPALPLPHPLEFEWRFSQQGAMALLNATLALGASDLLLLGATTVALTAAKTRWPGRIVAVERSQPITAYVSELGLPITVSQQPVTGSRILDRLVDAVIADPPWYVDDMRLFLCTAAASCMIGGHILVVCPGRGTRSGIDADEELLRSWCESSGLVITDVQRQAIAYETPFFEMNAFKAASVEQVPRFWRRGDLWVMRRVKEAPPPARTSSDVPAPWNELTLQRMRVWFACQATSPGRSALARIVDGDVLPTVSRRDPRRRRAAIWTSGNRIFACGDPQLLRAGVQADIHGLSIRDAGGQHLGRALTSDEVHDLTRSCSKVTELSNIESNEYVYT